MMERVEKTEPVGPYEGPIEVSRRYFEHMEGFYKKTIEDLEQFVDHRGAQIAHLELDIKSWRDKALFNSKWKNTVEEIRTIILALALMAAVTYYIHLKMGGNIPLYHMSCTLQEAR